MPELDGQSSLRGASISQRSLLSFPQLDVPHSLAAGAGRSEQPASAEPRFRSSTIRAASAPALNDQRNPREAFFSRSSTFSTASVPELAEPPPSLRPASAQSSLLREALRSTRRLPEQPASAEPRLRSWTIRAASVPVLDNQRNPHESSSFRSSTCSKASVPELDGQSGLRGASLLQLDGQGSLRPGAGRPAQVCSAARRSAQLPCRSWTVRAAASAEPRFRNSTIRAASAPELDDQRSLREAFFFLRKSTSGEAIAPQLAGQRSLSPCGFRSAARRSVQPPSRSCTTSAAFFPQLDVQRRFRAGAGRPAQPPRNLFFSPQLDVRRSHRSSACRSA